VHHAWSPEGITEEAREALILALVAEDLGRVEMRLLGAYANGDAVRP